MKTADRYLLHTIDSATRSGSREKGASWSGTFAVLVPLGVVIALLLWADRAFV